MRKVLALTLLLLSITYTQAQDWINNESTLLYEDNLKSNENSQCIEEYNIHHLLTTTNKIGTNRYAFRVWKNGSGIFEGFLNDPNLIVSDIEIFDDSVYFCGYREVNGNQIGYIGRFNILHFFSNQNCQYQIMPITTSSKLKKLVAYESNNRDHIVAIGADTANSPIIVDLFPDSICGTFISTSFTYEQLTDIAVGNNCVLIIGEDSDSAKITINRFDKDNLTSNLNIPYSHRKYNYNAITNISPIMIFSDQIKISYIDNGEMAITTTAIGINGNSYYTLVSVIDEITLNITNTQAIVYNDKMIKIKDTEYDFNTQLLYVLEENNIENTGNFETYTLVVDPNTQTPYSLKAIKAEKDYKINDIIAYSLGDKFMGIGINSNNFQGLFSKKVSNGLQHCNVERDLKTIILGQITDMNMMIYSPNSYTNNWFTDNFQGNNYSQIIECLSN